MTTLRQAAEQALEVLEDSCYPRMSAKHSVRYDEIITALRAALAEPEPHNQFVEDFWDWLPKAYRDGNVGDEPKFTKYNMEVAFAAGAEAEGKRIALAEPERKPLTDKQIDECWYQSGGLSMRFARAIEAAHGITGESK